MPRLAVIGDVHARFDRLAPVLDRIREEGPDGILLVGDLGSNDLSLARLRTPQRDARYRASLEELFARVGALGLPTLYVPGNHDLPDLDHPGNVDGRVAEVAGLRVGGIGGAGPARFGFCYEWDEEHVRDMALPPCDVLLAHCPPARTWLDWVPSTRQHVGSEAVREKASAHVGMLVCGHIHESPDATQIFDCLCLNVGGLGEPYGKPQVGWIVRDGDGDRVGHEDLESGEVRWWRRSVE